MEELPRTFTPEDQMPIKDLTQQQGIAPDQHPNEEMLNAPTNPFSPENQPIQRQHLNLPDIGHPQIGPQPQQPSIPDPNGPTPEDPHKIPGTFSSLNFPVFVLNTDKFVYAKATDLDMIEQRLNAGERIVCQLRKPAHMEQRQGKIPMPNAMPSNITDEGVEIYKVMDLGYNPETGERENNEVGNFNPSTEQRGKYSEIKAGRRGSIIDVEPLMKMVLVQVPFANTGALLPRYAEAWLNVNDIAVLPPNTPAPFGVR